MNLKYYLRGLGIGIIVTALIMGITAGRKEPLSDAEIKERAKALGMVEEENTLLKDLEDQAAKEDAPEPVETEDMQEAATPEASEAQEESAEPEEMQEAATPEAPEVQEESPQPEETVQPDAEPEEENQDDQGTQGSVTIQIARGDGSYTVSKKLEEAGLVESATAYDQFLYQNGYDKKIRAGSVEIPAGAADEQIARIICGIE